MAPPLCAPDRIIAKTLGGCQQRVNGFQVAASRMVNAALDVTGVCYGVTEDCYRINDTCTIVTNFIVSRKIIFSIAEKLYVILAKEETMEAAAGTLKIVRKY